MPDPSQISRRKADHIRINLDEDVQSSLTTGLEKYRFVHEALPDIDLKDVDTSLTFFNKELAAPILISSMTGGTQDALRINTILAEVAESMGLAMGVGSQRAAIEQNDTTATFQVRKAAPSILLFANLGAIQLNYGFSVDTCKQAVEMIAADALVLHLNGLQEALQPEGETNFKGLLGKIEKVCRQLPVPVVVKEVGWGISGSTARRLAEVGVSAIDVAGAGGTSWSQVEKYRLDERAAAIAEDFRGWGIPTAESILMVKEVAPRMDIIASGGLRRGVDIAKCIALGARLGGLAGPFLKAASVSMEKAMEFADDLKREIMICMFSLGISTLGELKNTDRISKLIQ